MAVRVWQNSGFVTATPLNVRIWKDEETEPNTSTEELIYDRVKLKKVAQAMARAWVEHEDLDVGEYVVHIKDVDSQRFVDVTVTVVNEKRVSVS